MFKNKSLMFDNRINSDLFYINDILNENGEISQNLILDKLKYKNNWIYIYIFIWKNYPFTTGATTTGVAVAASKIYIIKLYTVHTKNNIYSEMSHNFSLKCLSFC